MIHSQPYASLSQFVRAHRVQILPRPHESWRLVGTPVLGGVIGLDSIRGLAIATNGIIVCLLTSANAIKFGHLQWFEKDADERDSDLDIDMAVARGETAGIKRKVECLMQFSELFE